MTELSDFQQVVSIGLGISDEQAATIRRSWPENERVLRRVIAEANKTTGANVPGHVILSVCRELWRQRPEHDEFEMIEGRKIFYHPVNGRPIPENHPLDKLPEEMLIFLRWAYERGSLDWFDDITIAREAQSVEGAIDFLPEDRFFAKNSLPRRAGRLDWADLDLAKARNWIINGPETTAPHKTEEPLYFDESTLAGVLSSIPALRDKDNRDHLLHGLPPGPAGAIGRNSAFSTDLANLVQAVNDWGTLTDGRPAVNVLIDNAIKLVRGTAKEQALKGFKI